MKNTVTCNICSEKNAFYNLKCKSCKGFLRDKVPNIDFWKVVLKLFESPTEAFRIIIFSEHKNFILILSSIIAMKMILLISFIFIFILNNSNLMFSRIIGIGTIILICTYFLLAIFSYLTKILLNKFKTETRIKDIFSVLIYSLIGYAFSITLLFPIEVILFGSSLFQNSPSPFFLKPIPAYSMFGFECLFVFWSIFLMNRALFVFSKNLSFPFFFSLFFLLVFYSLPIVLVNYIF